MLCSNISSPATSDAVPWYSARVPECNGCTRGVHMSDKDIWWMVDYVAENVRYKYGSARMKMWRKRDGGDRWVSVLQIQWYTHCWHSGGFVLPVEADQILHKLGVHIHCADFNFCPQLGRFYSSINVEVHNFILAWSPELQCIIVRCIMTICATVLCIISSLHAGEFGSSRAWIRCSCQHFTPGFVSTEVQYICILDANA